MTSRLDRLLDRSLETAFGRDEIPRPDHLSPVPDRVGRYTITRRLGSGGIGSVYLGHDAELGRDVAIKVLHERHVRDEALIGLFREEARTCSQLQHPGIVSIHEFGKTDDGRAYYTMRVVAGSTLQELLREDVDPTPRTRMITIVERAAQAVAFAHRHGVVHGDLTPANIMVGAFGEVQVLDWGLCRREGQAGRATRPAPAVGTPAYMAPEQAGGDQQIDRRTDVFGLGAILCHVLTGAPPYLGDSIYQVHERASNASLDGARERLAAVTGDRDLAELAGRCLATDPDDRPEDAGVVADALAQHLVDIEARARTFEVEAAEQRARAVAARRARRLTTALAAVVVLTVIAGSSTALWWRNAQQARRFAANERASAALTAARQSADAAEGIAAMQRALGAVSTATVACLAPDVDARFADDVERLRAEVTSALAAAQRDERSRQLLAERRWHAGDDRTPDEIERDYVDSFARCGVDIDASAPTRAAGAIRRHRLQMELSAALHWWALQRREARRPGDDAWQPLLELAELCDDDDRRTDLRSAFLAGDVGRLLKIAGDDDAVELPPSTADLLAKFLVASGEGDAALRLYRAAHLRHPHDYNLCHELATLLLRRPDTPHEEVARLMTVGAALRPDSPHALVDQALTMIELGRFDIARPLAERARTLDPDYARAWFCTSVLADHDGYANAALDAARRYARLQDDSPHSQLLLANTLEKTGALEQAIAACRAAVAARPEWAEALITLARMLGERGELVEAIECATRAHDVATARNRGRVELLFGRLLTIAKLHARAVAPLRQAVALLPEDAAARFHLGAALLATGDYDEAARQFDAATERDGDRSVGPALQRLLRRTERYVELIGDDDVPADEVARPDHAVIFGDLAAARGDDDTAVRMFARADELAPNYRSKFAERWARAAARLAFGDGAPTTQTRRELAKKALGLLRKRHEELTAAADDDAGRAYLRRAQCAWLLAPELTPSRSPDDVAWMTDAARGEWRRFWATVTTTRPGGN